MITAKVFKSGNSQAIRLPKEFRTDVKEFIIEKKGDTFLLYPPKDPWYPARQVIGTFPEDFMSDREQPSWDDIPEIEL